MGADGKHTEASNAKTTKSGADGDAALDKRSPAGARVEHEEAQAEGNHYLRAGAVCYLLAVPASRLVRSARAPRSPTVI